MAPAGKGRETGRTLDQALYPLARQWNYLLNDRERMTTSGLAALGNRARADLVPFGLGEEVWNDLAASEFVEVSIHFVDEKENYAARLFPWEQLLSAATWSRRSRRVHITRHLRRADEGNLPPAAPESLLTAACAPGRLAEKYAAEFDGECRFVESILAPTQIRREHLEDPTRDGLKQALQNLPPGVLHLACVDSLLGMTLFPGLNVSNEEGVLLADAEAEVDPVSAAAFGQLLKREPRTGGPVLVAFSTCYSAYRSAALAVAHAARLAVGFSGPVDSALAEQFFSNFYRRWIETGWDALAAFEAGRVASLASPLGRSGQAVVLWSGASLVKGRAPTSSARSAARRRLWSPSPSPFPGFSPSLSPIPTFSPSLSPSPAAGPDTTAPGAAPVPPPPVPPPAGTPVAPGAVEAEVDPLTALNYSLLHHRRGLFRQFRLRNLSPQSSPVQVTVELYTGEERFPWRDSFELAGFESRDLTAEIEVPLLSELLRRARESLRTSLFVEVKAGAQTLVHRTFGIELLSADEWRDEKESWNLLPSFVLPRDPAVVRLLGTAERYLKAIADDFNAGFDGYQQAAAPDFATVDQQVRAIWSALQHELPLTYINPPPTYTTASQRVRALSRVTPRNVPVEEALA